MYLVILFLLPWVFSLYVAFSSCCSQAGGATSRRAVQGFLLQALGLKVQGTWNLWPHGLSCPAARGSSCIRRLNPCPQHWQAGFYPSGATKAVPRLYFRNTTSDDSRAASTLLQPRGLSSNPCGAHTAHQRYPGACLSASSGSCPLHWPIL